MVVETSIYRVNQLESYGKVTESFPATATDMAYAAVNSLLYTVDHLLKSNRISYSPSTSETLDFALDRVKSLQETLREFDGIRNNSRGVMSSEARIRDEARRLEDAIESHASTQFLSQSQTHGGCPCPPTLSLTLEELREEIDCFAETADGMEAEYIEELHKPSIEEEEEDAAAVSRGDDSGGDMVGISDLFLKIKNLLVAKDQPRRTAICISGMAGIGKTMLAKKVYNDSMVKAEFECQAFVSVGRNYELEVILRAIMAQVNLNYDKIIREEGEDLGEHLKRTLSGRKYLIVLDDTWDLRFFLDLKRALPNEDNGSRILLASRKTRSISSGVRNAYSFTMPLLDEEESWELLKKKVFGEEECPHQLKKAGKKIAKNCEGLPLLIIVVAAKIVSEEQRNVEYWNEVAEKQNSVFEDACYQISEVLLLSYHYMRQYFKLCFLYIGVFPQNYIVRRSRIIKLWRAEGFLEHSGDYAIDKFASYNLILVCKRCFVNTRVHSYRLHPAYWYMCIREAEDHKFFCTLKGYADGSIERLRSQRCFAIYNNVLFAIKEVHDSLASVSAARSVLCTGPYHQYQVPICFQLRLLRVLDALTIRFYEFPDEVVKLIQLRYLALTCDANLPRSIAKLWRLDCLIVHHHLSIKSISDDELYLPLEIWDLQELRHLDIDGRNLPNPPPCKVLPNLKKLINVGAQSCSLRVLESIPNLMKLRIQMESAQNLSLFDHISCLDELESLQSVILNPELLCEPIVPRHPPLPISIDNLRKLSLSGFGYPWEDMSKIVELAHLAELKLQNYAFKGEKWETKEGEFSNLKYLFIEDTDLVQWTAADGTFPRLWRLTMKNCYNLEEIPLFASDMEVQLSPFIVIELVDCNPLAETCAKLRYDERVNAKYSWK